MTAVTCIIEVRQAGLRAGAGEERELLSGVIFIEALGVDDDRLG